MTWERGEVEDQLEAGLRERVKERTPELERSVHEAASMEHLTGMPEWDGLLHRIETFKRMAEGAQKQASEVLHDPQVVDAEIVMRTKIMHAAATAAIEAYSTVMAIPKALIEEGKKAKRGLDA